MKQATFYVSINRPTKIIYHALSTFRGAFYLLSVVAFTLIIQPVRFNNRIVTTSTR